MRRFKLAKDSGAIWVDKPVTEKEMLSMTLQSVADMQQQLQQGLLDLREGTQKQLQASSTPVAAAAAAEPPPAATGSGHGEAELQQQKQQQPVSEEEELAAILEQLRSGPDGLSAAALAEQQREELVAAEEEEREEAAAEADEDSGGPPTAQGEVSGSAGRGPTSRGYLCRKCSDCAQTTELKCTARGGYVCVSTGRLV
jgi:hypothetical protein